MTLKDIGETVRLTINLIKSSCEGVCMLCISKITAELLTFTILKNIPLNK